MTHLVVYFINHPQPTPLRKEGDLIIVQQVLLRRRNRLSYTWIRCSRHLSHGEHVTLDRGEKWLVVEIFMIKKLKDEEELIDLRSRKKVMVVKRGGSYEIRELNDKGRPKKNLEKKTEEVI